MTHSQKVRKTIVTFLFLVAITIIPPATAYAYSLQSYRLPKGTTQFMYGKELSDYPNVKTQWTNAVNSWNNISKAPVKFSSFPAHLNSLSVIVINSSTLYGVTNSTTSGGKITQFLSLVNMGNPKNSSSNVIRSVACHELGHLLGLADLSSGTAIMNNNRNRGTLYTPQKDDINGVHAGY